MLAVICSISTFQPHFRGSYVSFIRAGTFGSLAIFTMIPVVHGTLRNGWHVQNQQMGVGWVLITLVVDILGAAAYALKVCKAQIAKCIMKTIPFANKIQIPERWWKQTFDIYGASHQIFHLLVIVAALTYTKGLLQAFDYVHADDGILCSPAKNDMAFHVIAT